jgi:hypothetical protein
MNTSYLDYRNLTLQEMIEYLRKYSKVIIYNEDIRSSFGNEELLNDMFLVIVTSKEDIVTYTKLFFQFIANLTASHRDNQRIVFNVLFKRNHKPFVDIVKLHKNDLKIHKFLLSIIYNVLLLNKEMLKALENCHLDLIVTALLNFTIEGVCDSQDKVDVNDWIHVVLNFILNDEDCASVLRYFLNSEKQLSEAIYIRLLEYIRDVVDFSKEKRNLIISRTAIELIVTKFNKLAHDLLGKVEKLSEEGFPDYETLVFSNEQIFELTLLFREFICFVDILSVIVIIEDYREITQNCLEIFDLLYRMLTITDPFYDGILKRGRLLNSNIKAEFNKENTKEIDENNLFFSFQTNIVKMLSNYSYKNENLKKTLEPTVFYYLLNHMKLDKCNPFKKEWTVLLVKSLSEDNYKIQTLIEELKPIDIDPLLKDYLQKNNYNFKFEVGTHKVRVQKNEEEDNE